MARSKGVFAPDVDQGGQVHEYPQYPKMMISMLERASFSQGWLCWLRGGYITDNPEPGFINGRVNQYHGIWATGYEAAKKVNPGITRMKRKRKEG